VLVAVVGAACSDPAAVSTVLPSTTIAPASTVTSDASTTMELPSTTVEPSTTTVAPTTTATVEAGPPRVNMRPRSATFVIEEWERIFRQFSRYEDWLGEHPTDDEEILEAVYHPDGPRFAARRKGLARLREEGLTITNAGPGDLLALGRLSESDELDDGEVIVIVATESEGGVAYDSEGEVIEELPGWRSRDFDVRFRRVGDGRWLVWDLEVASQ
jgi:hypothetical protein